MSRQPEINGDCAQMVVLRPADMVWEDTEQAGVSRVVLERIKHRELGRETALVRLAPGTRLAPEVLDRRLEIFVIEGTFSDGHGDYGARTFIMNPPGTTYAAASQDGCQLYVKRLDGFSGDDARIVIELAGAEWTPFGHRVAEVVPFYKVGERDVTARVGHVFPNARIVEHNHPGGEEVLILDGVVNDQFGDALPGTWMRYPIGLPHAPQSGEDGALIYIRDGDVRW